MLLVPPPRTGMSWVGECSGTVSPAEVPASDPLTPPFGGQLRPFLGKMCLLISTQHPFIHVRKGFTGASFPSLHWTSEKALTQRTQTQLVLLGSSHLCFPADWQAILFLLLVSSLNNENVELQCDNSNQRLETSYTITTVTTRDDHTSVIPKVFMCIILLDSQNPSEIALLQSSYRWVNWGSEKWSYLFKAI